MPVRRWRVTTTVEEIGRCGRAVVRLEVKQQKNPRLIVTDMRKTFGYLSGLDRTSVTAGRVQDTGGQPSGPTAQLTLTISTEQVRLRLRRACLLTRRQELRFCSGLSRRQRIWRGTTSTGRPTHRSM